MPVRRLFPLLLLLLSVLVLLALGTGSVRIPWSEAVSALFANDGSTASEIVREYRLPRIGFAFVIGATLALAGALMQTLLRNPLADPYILGTSGGAAAGVLVSTLLMFPAGLHPVMAVTGAVISTLLLFLFSGFLKVRDTNRLLLTGIVLTTGWGALISFILAISPDSNIRSMLFWLMGDLSYALSPLPALFMLLVGLLVSWPLGRDLNVLIRGELQAGALGIDSNRIRYERFSDAAIGDSKPIRVELRRSGKQIEVAADQSVLDAMLDAGVNAPYSCRAGTCRTCAVEVLDGDPDHRDFALSDVERDNKLFCPCVSRARGTDLVLDI